MNGNNYNPYNSLYSNYNPNLMTPQNSQPQIQCYAVNNREEANRIQIPIGVMCVILNRVQKEVYIKKWNNDGLIDLEVYKDEKTIPVQKEEKDYTSILAALTSKIDEIQKSLTPKQEITQNVSNAI